MEREFNDQELVRRQKAEELRAKGIDPFGQAFVRTANSKSIKEQFGSLSKEEIDYLGKTGTKIPKVSRRDLPVILSRKETPAWR